MLNLDWLQSRFPERLKLNEPLARYTVARLGGPADALISADSAAMLSEVVQCAWKHGYPTRILGGGANVLVSNQGYRGLVVINDAKAINVNPGGLVTADSGAILTHIARHAMSEGLAGFEWAVSVPRTLGGAIVNNSGAHGRHMAQCLARAVILGPD